MSADLAAYARWLLPRVPALAAVQAGHLVRQGLVGWGAEALASPLEALLAALAAEGPLPDPDAVPVLPGQPPNTPRGATVLAYHARELALLEQLPAYTADAALTLALATELRALHAGLHALDAERHTDEFLGMVSHELRTPVHVLTGFGEILRRGLAGPLTEAQRGYLDKVMDVARALARLVDDLIDVAQIGAGAFALEPGPTDFPALAKEALARHAPLAAAKQLQLADDVPAALPPVRADAQRLQQVLANVLGNAIKYTPAGGQVRLRAGVKGRMLRVEVHDTGPGIAEEDLEPIFQRFVRRGPERNGLGLGLPISRAIVAGHGGSMGVASTPGRGSVFHFELPLFVAVG